MDFPAAGRSGTTHFQPYEATNPLVEATLLAKIKESLKSPPPVAQGVEQETQLGQPRFNHLYMIFRVSQTGTYWSMICKFLSWELQTKRLPTNLQKNIGRSNLLNLNTLGVFFFSSFRRMKGTRGNLVKFPTISMQHFRVKQHGGPVRWVSWCHGGPHDVNMGPMGI